MRRGQRQTVTARRRGPFAGLVSRFPSDVSDKFQGRERGTPFDVAENVRFDGGVVRNAPGYELVRLHGEWETLLHSLYAHYDLDEATGATRADTHGSLDLSDVSANITQETGLISNAAGFNVVGELRTDAADTPSLGADNESFGVSLWFKSLGLWTVDDNYYLFHQSEQTNKKGWRVYVEVSDSGTTLKISFGLYNDGLGGSVRTCQYDITGVDTNWHHVAACYDNEADTPQIRLYYDGVLQHSLSIAPADVVPSIAYWAVGGPGVNAGLGTYASANIDEISVFKGSAFTASEVETLYNAGAGATYPSPLLEGDVNMLFQADILDPEPRPVFLGVDDGIYKAVQEFTDDDEFSITLTSLYTGGTASQAERWYAVDYFDKVLFAQASTQPQYYKGSSVNPIPGLGSSDTYDGVEAFFNFAVLWVDQTVKWSDNGDFTNWIPIGTTVSSLTLTLTDGFTQPAAGGSTGWFDVDESTVGLTVGQYVRIDDNAGSPEYYNFYTVEDVSPAAGLTVNTVDIDSSPAGTDQSLPDSTTTKLFVKEFVAWEEGQRLSVAGSDVVEVASVSPTNLSVFTLADDAWLAAYQELTFTANPGNAETVTLGTTGGNGSGVYRFVNTPAAAGDVQIGETLQESIQNLISAINLDGTPGAYWTSATNENTDAFARIGIGDTMVAVAKTPGGGNSVATTATLANGAWGGGTMENTQDSRLEFTINSLTTGLVVGDVVSIDDLQDPGANIFVIDEIVTGNDQTRLVMTKQNMGGELQADSFVYPRGETYLVLQPWVRITNNTGGAIGSLDNSAIVEKYAVKLTSLDLSGRTPTSSSIASGKQVVTLTANEVGETNVAGSDDNGPVWQVVSLGEYAYILRERSIQSMHYVGRESGTFFIRTEVNDAGLIGKNSWVKIGSRIIYLSHRELYEYRGGPEPLPVARQHTQEMLEDIDRGQADKIFIHHEELNNEIWVVYPSRSQVGNRVFVWNYVEDTCSTDTYDDSFPGFSDVKTLVWEESPSWNGQPINRTWESDYATTNGWDDVIGSSDERRTIMAVAADQPLNVGPFVPSLVEYGAMFSRNGEAYTSKAETHDFDLGDPTSFKYMDSVQVGIDVKNTSTSTRTFKVQVGVRKDLDDTITWSSEQTLDVKGDGNYTTKVNPGGSGRFIRLRFLADSADVEWRVSQFLIVARKGGSY